MCPDLNRSVLTAKASRSGVKHSAASRLFHKDDRQRRRAVRKLFELDDPEYLSGFIPLLNDEDSWFRQKAMEAVGRWLRDGHGEVVDMLAKSTYVEQRVLATRLALRSGEGGGEVKSYIPERNRGNQMVAKVNKVECKPLDYACQGKLFLCLR